MGSLHEGHLRLVDRARECADRVALSIFVNPLQFGPQEDFASYPRDLARDRALAAARGVDALFAPAPDAMYPVEPLVRVAPGPMADAFEGAVRPGHFGGVLTVVAKLFHAAEPDVVVFGRKDFQQAMLVRRMVADLDFPLEVEVAPTVRELDGPGSSPQRLPHGDEGGPRRCPSPAGDRAGLARGQADAAALGRARGAGVPTYPDYLALVDDQLRPVERADAHSVVITAARLGRTRLLDNAVLGEGVARDPVAGAA
jgi:pantoate--beta-alanine ligase